MPGELQYILHMKTGVPTMTEGVSGNGVRPPSRVRRRRLFYSILGALLGLSVLAGVLVALGADRKVGVKSSLLPPARAPEAPLEKLAAAVGFQSTIDESVGAIEKLVADVGRPPTNPSLLPVGAQAPSFTLQSATGERVGLSDFKGKTVLLEFFATWSPQSQAEAEHLVAIRAASSVSKLVFLAVNADGEDAASLYAFDQHFAVSYPSLLDPGKVAGSFSKNGSPGPVTQSYHVETYPTFYIVDSNGRVAWRSDGEQPDAFLMKRLGEISRQNSETSLPRP
ncbi:MAG TPA: TlpA disulfide reductase family protein [Spirochaetia bacterium]|nr:TlpA disulfide reductase family protein [Spirochaetia bacterium]